MKTQRRAFLHSVAAACLAAFCVSVQAEPDLLQPDEAFRVSARRVDARVVELEYIIAPGYHLYRDRFSFKTDNPAVTVAGVELPPPLEKFDKAMGQNMRYYTERVAVRVRLAGANQTVKLLATAQGCAAIVGVCYAPITKAFSVPAMGGKQG
ncbi:MAG TPA: protein-disulfide reductase DsbD N-terminal domain-containing protein [Telluria sp.]